ncbi:MAG: SDR family oxidoreductase [Desulforhopalus sp.]
MKGKIAVVTGGSRGIGREIALECGRRGAVVAVNYSSDDEQAQQVVRHITGNGGQSHAFRANLARVEEVESLFDQVESHFGEIDILINNAGIMENRPIEQVSEEQFDRVFSLNVKGLFFCCQQAARRMRKGGCIINIGSSVTRVMLPNYGTYAASKGAVEQLTKVLAKELGAKGIRVNTVSPGPTDTELFRAGKTEEQIEALAAMSAFNRIAVPKDIARVVAMVCSEDAAWISGQNVLANGAFVA